MRAILSIVATALFALPTAAFATVFGSASFSNVRDCTGVAEGDFCFPTSGQLNDQIIEGSLSDGSEVSGAFSRGGFGSAQYSVEFAGEGFLPILKSEAISRGQGKALNSVSAQQGYRYTGSAPTPFPVVATYDFTLDSIGEVAPSQNVSVLYSGQAFTQARLTIFSDPIIGTDTFAAGACGDPGVIASDAGFTRNNGPGAISLFVGVGCDGQPVMLNPGDEIFVVAAIATTGLRGGEVDALNTFQTAFADSLSALDKEFLLNNLEAASEIPIPAAAPLFLLGLSGLAALRRRKRTQA